MSIAGTRCQSESPKSPRREIAHEPAELHEQGIVQTERVAQLLNLLVGRLRAEHQPGGVAQEVRDEEDGDHQAEQDEDRVEQRAGSDIVRWPLAPDVTRCRERVGSADVSPIRRHRTICRIEPLRPRSDGTSRACSRR